MKMFYCLSMFSKNEARYFDDLENAQKAAEMEDVKPGDCIFQMELIGGEYEIVDEYGIECLQ